MAAASPIPLERMTGTDSPPVEHRSRFVNVYHCCVHKTGSQWVKKLASDARTYSWSGLAHHDYERGLPGGYDPRGPTQRTFATPFPAHTIVSPLYLAYANFRAAPKPDRYRAFFVMRDPRDVVVSYYFSTRYSHALMSNIAETRRLLDRLSVEDGMLHSVESLARYGLFATLRSWVDAPQMDKDVLLIRFEDLTAGDNHASVGALFAHCDIRMPAPVLGQLLRDYGFRQLSGRAPGEEDKHSHYRKGIHGDWKNHFTDRVQARFDEVTGDLVARLGYG